MQRSPSYKSDRNHAIWLARKQGKTLKEIGDEYGIGKERVRQICLKEERIEYFHAMVEVRRKEQYRRWVQTQVDANPPADISEIHEIKEKLKNVYAKM